MKRTGLSGGGERERRSWGSGGCSCVAGHGGLRLEGKESEGRGKVKYGESKELGLQLHHGGAGGCSPSWREEDALFLGFLGGNRGCPGEREGE